MRLIDADALLKKVERILPWAPYPSKYAQGIRYCMELVSIHIKDAPTVEPERKKGKWMPDNTNYYEERYICLECGRSYKVDMCMGKPMWNFCPNCSADMREEQK